MGNRIVIKGRDGEFGAYIARPVDSPAPAVVVLQELFGVNADIRKHCDELAELGFVAGLRVDHLSPYQLTIEPGAAFHRRVQRGSLVPLDADRAADFYETTQRVLEGTGFEAYEISKRLLLAWLPYATAAGSERRIRFNAITPGPVETPLLPGFRQSMGADRIEAARNLVGRHARAEEIATAILFLLGPAASWINGTEIVADGGLTALREAAAA